MWNTGGMEKQNFTGAQVAITGGASGIGFALGKALLAAGANVTLGDWNAKSLAEVTEQLSNYGDRVTGMQLDVSDQQQVAKFVTEAAARGGRLDYLFNNAGVGGAKPTMDWTLADWQRIININMWGTIYGVMAAMPIMVAQGNGHIVNTASIWGLLPGIYEVPYSTSKHAIVGLSESLSYELAPKGVQVTVLCPAGVVTGIFAEGTAPADAISADEAAQEIMRGLASGEVIIPIGEPAVVAWGQHQTDPPAIHDYLIKREAAMRAGFGK